MIWIEVDEYIRQTIFNNIYNDFEDNQYLPDSQILFEMFDSKYSNRKISSYMSLLLTKYINNVTIIANVCDYIKKVYYPIWSELIKTIKYDFDALSPFDITLIEESTDSFKTVKDITENTAKDKVYGFNSYSAKPTDESNGSVNKEYERENPRTRNYTRKGNIGNTSKQDLIRQQREIVLFNLTNQILKDVAKVVCRAKYN